MLEDKVREIFADMVVLKDPQRSEYFSNLSIPSYMRDWLVMKFSDDNGTIDYESVGRYIKRYIPSREDFEQYKFQIAASNKRTVSAGFFARSRNEYLLSLPDASCLKVLPRVPRRAAYFGVPLSSLPIKTAL